MRSPSPKHALYSSHPQVYIEPLSAANPPIIKPELLTGFISQVFGNVAQILAHHQLMLAALFARQREQHPLIQSVADIILDTILKGTFRTAYETYIKHYPLAEAHHRKELNRNSDYRHFIQSAASDPRIRKRDLVTFLSRPVTRLPRLNLLIEQLHKLTEHAYDHPDLDTLPTISGILKDFIKVGPMRRITCAMSDKITEHTTRHRSSGEQSQVLGSL